MVKSTAESLRYSWSALNARVPPELSVLNFGGSPRYVMNRVSGSFCAVREYAVRQSTQACDQWCSPPS